MVGVIVNLALFFAFAILYQNNQIDWIAIAITIIAFIALFRFKVGIMSVIFLSGVIGLGIVYFG